VIEKDVLAHKVWCVIWAVTYGKKYMSLKIVYVLEHLLFNMNAANGC
jgi:hypothetical protein